MTDITIILTEKETQLLIKALYNYHYQGLEQHENTILDIAQAKINYQYINQKQ